MDEMEDSLVEDMVVKVDSERKMNNE